jgi:hypothetical protein
MSRALSLLCLIPLTAALARADEKPTPLKLVRTWSGEVKLDVAKDAPKDGFVTENETFGKFWKAFRGDEKVPEIDFTKELVLVAVGKDPNKLGIGATLDDKGNLKVLVRSTLVAYQNPTTAAYQFGTVPRPLVRLPEGIQVQRDAFEPEIVPQTGAHQYLLGIDVRPAQAEGFDADLVKLPVAPLLRPLVAEHRPEIVQPLCLLRRQVVLDQRTHATGRTFGPQRQRFAVEAVDEGIHFFFDDVGDFANGTFEQWRRLDDRQTQGPIAVTFQPAADRFLEKIPKFGLVGEDVVHPAHRLDFRQTHDAANFLV